MISPADQIARLEACIRMQMQEIDRQRALIDRKDADIDTLVQWIAGDGDALGALRSVYADPRSTPSNKVKAAGAAIGFERSKPAEVSIQMNFTQRVHDARVRRLELDRAEWRRQEAQGEPAA